MEFNENPIRGSFTIDIRPMSDDRGFFARTWCADELAKAGLNSEIAQINTALSLKSGTIRGMHLQSPPHAEVKIVSCTAGAIFDVVLDLRADSETYLQWYGIELSARNQRMLYIPEGCAHGYQTLADNSVLSYTTSVPYAPQAATGVRYNDAAFGIIWKKPVTVISAADAGWPDYAA